MKRGGITGSQGGALGKVASAVLRDCLKVGLSWSDRVVAISEATQRSLQAHLTAKPVELVPMGIPALGVPRNAQARQSPEYDVLAIGRLVRIKRFADLVRALGILKRGGGWNGKAVIVGSGPEFPHLLRLVNQLGMEENVYLPGLVNQAQKAEFLRKSRVFVLCSEREGFGLSALEALSFGLPVVLAKPPQPEVFGPGQFVHDGVNGLYYPLGCTDCLASQILSLLDSPPRLERLRSSALDTAEEYLWDTITSRFLTQLREWLSLRS